MSTSSMMTESSVEQLTIPFPREIVRVFKELDRIKSASKLPNARNKPSPETIAWATEVLLRVVPSTFLIGADIEAFQSEIHVSWDSEARGKNVVVYLPSPNVIKIYRESRRNGEVKDELFPVAVHEVSAHLQWFFQN